MYSNYTALQREQLAKQTYIDTQGLYLLIYAPGRRTLLEASLSDQLHRKFRCVDHLGDALTSDVDGVVLATEDAQWLPTALMQYADALRAGADLVVSDAVYGFGGETALYQSHSHCAHAPCALVSRELLERCRAEARDPENVAELLELAYRLHTQRTCVPLALLRYPRDLSATDAFSPNGRRALLMSHVLDMTGAPIVLVSAVPVLRSLGYEVVVLGPEDGGSLELFVDAGAAVVTRAGCTSSAAQWGLALSVDLVLANTIVEARAVRALSGTPVPVLWWLHDAFAGYPHIAHQIPRTLGKNVQLYAVGNHAAAAMLDVRPDFNIRPLIYGLPDYAQEDFPREDLGYSSRPLFATVGSFERRKGQDILCKAIRLLDPAVRAKANFLFVGKAADKEMMDAVTALTDEHPENVFYCKRMSRSEIKCLMEQCTGLICASRDDPMPTFVTEGLIFGKPSIVSEHTGTAGLITEGVDGFVYNDDDPAQLAAALTKAIEAPEALAAMAPACRRLYETRYSKPAFVAALTAAVHELVDEAE